MKKEVYHILRDRRTLAVLVLLPVVQVILFGYTISTDVRDVRLGIVDPSPDATTIALRNRFAGSGRFRIVAVAPTRQALAPLFRRDTLQVAVEFEPGFGEKLAHGEPAQLLVTSDAADPNAGTSRTGYVRAEVDAFDRERRDASRSTGPIVARMTPDLRVNAQARARFNPTLSSTNLFIPGLMALVLNIISALMTALSLTREKETGTLEALLVSPLRPWQIVVGKVAPYVAIGFTSVLLVLAEARLVFHVPLRGSVTLLLAEGMLFILVALSLGILISAKTSSQRVAMMGAMLATMLPTQILSGFIFPLESMPWPLRWLANIVPGKWFVLIARGIMLKGIGLSYLWPQTLALLAMAVVLLGVASRSFKARLQ